MPDVACCAGLYMVLTVCMTVLLSMSMRTEEKKNETGQLANLMKMRNSSRQAPCWPSKGSPPAAAFFFRGPGNGVGTSEILQKACIKRAKLRTIRQYMMGIYTNFRLEKKICDIMYVQN